MRECRFFPWCSYIEDHGCTKDSCRRYQPMPDVDALLALADSLEQHAYEVLAGTNFVSYYDMCEYARRFRKALGVER